jgi:glutaredoxin|tara:strand:- start:442 stop:699 length:258 start_codon:yes stop_codon:yes gene_type:complete
MEIKIFSMKGCPHCDNLKDKLKENKIDFVVIDVDENEKLYEAFSKKVKNDFLPAILIDKTAFLPDKSFNTIDEAVIQIKTHLQVL